MTFLMALPATLAPITTDPITKDELNMLLLAISGVAPLPVYEVVQTIQDSATAARDMKYGVCKFVSVGDASDFPNELSPFVFMRDFLPKELLNRLDNTGSPSYQQDWEWFGAWLDSFSVTVLRQPEHGKMQPDHRGQYDIYLPNQGYIGKDRVDLLVEGKDDTGRPIAMTLVYYINVLTEKNIKAISGEKLFQHALAQYCGSTADNWRISTNH